MHCSVHPVMGSEIASCYAAQSRPPQQLCSHSHSFHPSQRATSIAAVTSTLQPLSLSHQGDEERAECLHTLPPACLSQLWQRLPWSQLGVQLQQLWYSHEIDAALDAMQTRQTHHSTLADHCHLHLSSPPHACWSCPPAVA